MDDVSNAYSMPSEQIIEGQRRALRILQAHCDALQDQRKRIQALRCQLCWGHFISGVLSSVACFIWMFLVSPYSIPFAMLATSPIWWSSLTSPSFND